eukprot:6577149-Ditylum_brightwellii.AAC.1
MEKLKAKLKKIKLSNYPGENIQKMNVDIKAQCDILDCADYWEKDLLHVITKRLVPHQFVAIRAFFVL